MNNFPTENELSAILTSSIKRFNDSTDGKTLLSVTGDGLEQRWKPFRVAHEQAISHRVAFYLECSLRQRGFIADEGLLVVDCEYNQHHFGPKRIRTLISEAQPFLDARRKPIPVKGSTELFDFDIRPDVLVHKRGDDGPTNLLALEVKRWTNPDRHHDKAKLQLLTKLGLNTFGYVLAAAVYVRNDLPAAFQTLELGPQFHNGQQWYPNA